MRRQPWLVVVLVGAVVGVVFAAVSTYDFVQHLDRQVHDLHCSFIPGGGHGAGESGCQLAMMSPYSSVLRSYVWGGIPISLAAMSVFAFLVFYTLDLMVTRRKDDPRATGFLALATALPALTSAVMLAISLSKLGTVCKLCVCIYVASAACLVGALMVWRTAVRARGNVEPIEPRAHPDERHRGEPAFVGRSQAASSGRLVAVGVDTGAASGGFLAAMFVAGVAFVAIPIVLYLAMAPDHARFIGTCEGLSHPDDAYGVMVRIERGPSRGAPTIEVLDPLCPACRAFEQRLAASGLADRLDRKAVLFPLDNTCNWMVTEATHPGACTVSEAVLCAGDRSPEVIAWAFEEQERVRAAARTDPAAAARLVKQRFPDLASCVGSPEARSRLNKSMRWIVANNIRVLTPQIFIDHVKLCDEDVDLGLEYTLSNMLERHAQGKLAPVPLEKGAPATRAAGDRPGANKAGEPGSAASADKASAETTTGKSPSDKSPSDKAPSDHPASGAASDKASSNNAASGVASDKAASDNASSDTAASDKGASDKAASGTAASDNATSGTAPDKAASDRAPSGSEAADKAAADKAAADKAAAGKNTSDKAAADKASDKASSDKAAADKPPGKSSPDKAASDNSSPDRSASDKPAPRKPTPRKPAPRKPTPARPAPDPGPSNQPVTRPGEVP